MNHEAFAKFLTDYKISYRRFADICGRMVIRKSSVHRLTKGEGTPDYIALVQPYLITAVETILRDTGKTADEIQTELKQIFEGIPTMITQRTKLDYEVIDFFGLERDPFALESDPRSAADAFSTKELERLARRVEDAIQFQGFIAVLGDIGAGKTSFKNGIADKVKTNRRKHLIFPKFVNMEKLNEGGIVHYLLQQFGQKPKIRLPLAQVQLEEYLAELHDRGERVALCFDECHRLADSTLTALKNFYELGTGGYDRYLGLILLGQPSFKSRLNRADFREIAERLEILEMPPLAKHAYEYIKHRLTLVGGDVEQLFEKRAIELIASQVFTPLAIGNLANKALIKAADSGDQKVTAKLVEKLIGKDEPKIRAVKQPGMANGGALR